MDCNQCGAKSNTATDLHKKTRKNTKVKRIIPICIFLLAAATVISGWYIFNSPKEYYLSKSVYYYTSGHQKEKDETDKIITEYCENGDVLKMDNNGNSITYYYDEFGMLHAVSYSNEKAFISYSHTGNEYRGYGELDDDIKIEMCYDENHKFISKRIFHNSKEAYSETKEYHPNGTIAQYIISNSVTSKTALKEITNYDKKGVITNYKKYDGTLLISDIKYKNGIISESYNVSSWGSDGIIEYYIVHYKDGNETETIYYDEDDNLVSRKTVESKKKKEIRTVTYDAKGNRIETEISYLDKQQNIVKIETCNADGTVIRRVEQTFDENRNLLTSVSYDAEGKVSSKTENEWKEKTHSKNAL